jgi:hypothetical protein
VSFAQYLRFISDHYDELLDCPPEAWINRQLIAEYVSLLRKTNQETSVATSLHHLRLALRLRLVMAVNDHEADRCHSASQGEKTRLDDE